MSDCIFCDIVAGSAPARIVYQDDAVLGFLDIRPVTRGHTLLIPRAHSAGLADLDPGIAERLFAAGHRVGVAMRTCDLGADGVNLALNDGAAAFQTVFHTHLHVVPRRDGDRLRFAKGFLTRRSFGADGAAESLRAALPDFQRTHPAQ